MTRGAIVATEGFVEDHLVYARHRLREDGVVVEFVTPTGGAVRGGRGMAVEPTLDPDADADLDFVLVPGRVEDGALPESAREWLAGLCRSAAVVAGIGTGVGTLCRLGAVDDRMVAAPGDLAPTVREVGGAVTDDRVTVDGTLVTARDTDALPFFLVAVRNALAIPQDSARLIVNRPFQEQASWEAHR